MIPIPDGFRGKPHYTLLGNMLLGKKRRTRKTRKAPKQRGRGILDVLKKVWSFVNPVLKETKLASSIASRLPVVGPVAGSVLKSVGYGKKKKRTQRRKAKRGGRAGILV